MSYSLSIVVLILSSCCCFEAVVHNCTYSCRDITCPPVSSTSRCRSVYLDPCGCCSFCAKREGEKCGGKMNLWGSCEADYECSYRSGSVYNEEKFGFCEHSTCSSKECGYRQRCSLLKQDGRKVPTCVCPWYHCKGKVNLVCGYDGSTYSSVCHLQKAECTRGAFIGINHFGACDSDNTAPTNHAHLKTTPPSGWLIDSLVEPIECIFDGVVYLPGQSVDHDNNCLNISCTSSGMVLVVPIPGCGDNKPEKDYLVDVPPVYIWNGWSEWSNCLCDTMSQTRSRTCQQIQYEGVTKTNCSSIISHDFKPCNDTTCL